MPSPTIRIRDDYNQTVYVTQFLSLPVTGKVDGQDDAKAGHVTVISTATDSVTGKVTINPLTDTGFKATGDVIGSNCSGRSGIRRISNSPPALSEPIEQYRHKGNFAFVPNVGASPNGPVRFDVNTHSLLSAINRITQQRCRSPINMHLAVKNQTVTPKLLKPSLGDRFQTVSNEGYVVIAASNVVIKVVVDPDTGAATVQNDPADPDTSAAVEGRKESSRDRYQFE